MRVAILFAGQFRNSYELSKKFITWLRSQPSVSCLDVYVHIWWSPEYVGKRYRFDSAKVVEPDPTENIKLFLQPKKIVVEPHTIPDLNGLPYLTEYGGTAIERESCYVSMLCQFESLRRCINLIDEEYDYIIRARPDLVISDASRMWDLNIEKLSTNTIFIADGTFYTGWPLGDWLFIGNQKNMTVFLNSLKDNYIEHTLQLGKQNHIHRFIPEILKKLNLTHEPLYIYIGVQMSRGQMLEDINSLKEPYWWNWIPVERLLHNTR